MKISGLVVRTDVPLPPPSGPRRFRFMRQSGISALRDSLRLYGEVLRSVGCLLGDIGEIPIPFVSPLGVGRNQVELDIQSEWSSTREAIDADLRKFAPFQTASMLDYQQAELEEAAHRSLKLAVDAYNFLESDPLSDFAHQHAHKIGALTGGVFGCTLRHKEGTYYDTCPLMLMHNRWGYSMGFTSVRLCSICEGDIDACPHLLDEQYEVSVIKDGTGCSECYEESCAHVNGETVLRYPSITFGDVNLHEVSMVRYPRDPLARPTGIEISHEKLVEIFGDYPTDRELVCYRCLYRCPGFHDPWAQ